MGSWAGVPAVEFETYVYEHLVEIILHHHTDVRYTHVISFIRPQACLVRPIGRIISITNLRWQNFDYSFEIFYSRYYGVIYINTYKHIYI